MQDDLTKFVSDPTSPPQLVDIPEEGKGKERREVGEGDDIVVDAKSAPSAKHTASRTSWLHTRKE
jgi:hypothetical protein